MIDISLMIHLQSECLALSCTHTHLLNLFEFAVFVFDNISDCGICSSSQKMVMFLQHFILYFAYSLPVNSHVQLDITLKVIGFQKTEKMFQIVPHRSL